MLLSSSVPRSLDTRSKLFGFELSDLLIIFLYMSVSNLLFGTTKMKYLVVWAGTILIALSLHFVKRNKPDNHLQHWGEYQRSPGILTAGSPDTDYQPYFVGDNSNTEGD